MKLGGASSPFTPRIVMVPHKHDGFEGGIANGIKKMQLECQVLQWQGSSQDNSFPGVTQHDTTNEDSLYRSLAVVWDFGRGRGGAVPMPPSQVPIHLSGSMRSPGWKYVLRDGKYV